MCEYEQRWSLPTAEEIKAEVDWLADWLAREEPSMIGIDSRAAREFITRRASTWSVHLTAREAVKCAYAEWQGAVASVLDYGRRRNRPWGTADFMQSQPDDPALDGLDRPGLAPALAHLIEIGMAEEQGYRYALVGNSH
ncbi:hypothetical protein [Gordonia sp. UBA7599]|uniref:hypothetical protein n=1 Tax=unclassified Gordonia (in: high G+C Gram-positive bacteria) TaxID=2657482 RepID=UPI0025BEDCB7|nr:hypothetical protein [Gordonia sp. UBA7599]HNP58818.1 hypothetical protein [Gordonia sp. (in: high G+C Gram-positive bacteria)]